MSPRSPAPERAFRPAWAWLPEGLVRAPVIAVDGHGRLVPWSGGAVEELPGLVMPGMVNAHTHLELGGFPYVAGSGFVSWVTQMRVGTAPTAAHAGENVMAAIRTGTAAVGEVSNTGLSTPVLAAAGMPARAWKEVLGIDDPRVPEGDVIPHAPHTTHPAVIQAVAARGGPWSIHFDEDPEESAFLHGKGAWLPFMRAIGRDLAAFPVPDLSPAKYLESLGVLSPRTLLVHAAQTRGDDLDVIASSGARICLCPRSNVTITGGTADVPEILGRGIPVAIGTDSLGSSPDLDPVADVVELRRRFPRVPIETWMHALTSGGADALGLRLGRIREGEAPGLVHVEIAGDPLDSLFSGAKLRRRWLTCPLA